MIKTLTSVSTEGVYHNIIKAIYNKPTVNVILSGEKPKTFLLNFGEREECSSSPLLVNIILEVSATAIRQKRKKERKKRWYPYWNGEVKPSL